VCVASIRFNFTTTRKTSRLFLHLSFLLSTQITLACHGLQTYVLFPNAPKGKYPLCTKEGSTVDVSISNGLRRSVRETGVVIGDSDDKSKFQRWGERAEKEKCWSHLDRLQASEKGKCSSWQGWYCMQRFPRNLLWPCSCTQLFLSHFWSRYDHHSMSITILTTRILRDNILVPLSLRPCKLNTFVLLLVNQQLYLARQCCILWSLFPVPECPYLIPPSFNDSYPWNFISHYHAIPLPPVFSHLNA